jgi:hypothetical protein
MSPSNDRATSASDAVDSSLPDSHRVRYWELSGRSLNCQSIIFPIVLAWGETGHLNATEKT